MRIVVRTYQVEDMSTDRIGHGYPNSHDISVVSQKASVASLTGGSGTSLQSRLKDARED